jgi:hypothetical protein
MSYAATVQPQNGRAESLLIAVATVLVIAVTVALAALRTEESAVQPMQDWQISAFSGLSPVDQAVHSSLDAAVGEINWYYYRLTAWPDVPDLEAEFIPPFYKDIFWETNGRVNWKLGLPLNSDQGATFYHGSGGTAENQSAYLLILAHIHAGMLPANQSTIWVNADPYAPFPDVVKPEQLILSGWKQVVPYSGKDELERLKGVSS